MKLKVAGLTDVGLKRENNQDNFLIDESLGLYIVADGMGGHLGGEVASQLSVQSIRSVVEESFEGEAGVDVRDLLQRAFTVASRSIYRRSEEDPKLKGMGTTTVAGLLRDKTLYIANVGDSRCYLIHPPHIWQVTEDHSLLNEQIRAGLIKSEQAAFFAGKNVITRSVGFEEQVTCDVLQRDLREGDCILLCSDGLTGLVSDRRICDVCLMLSFEEVVPRLIEEAKRNGGDDNVTVVFLRATT